MDESTAKKLTKARANLIMMHPFFGALALRLKMIESDSIPTAGCDGRSIYYNPKWVKDLSLSKTQGLVAHEVMHPAFLHTTRRGAREPGKWNVACDYAINNILVDAGFELPDDGCVDAKYKGMTAEHIYSILPPDSTGNNYQGFDPGGCGAVLDAPGSGKGGAQTPSEAAASEADWKVALAQAAHVAKQAGKLPGDIERMLSELLEPVLPWRSILQRFMTEKALDDFSWRRGNRRFISTGMYLPSRVTDPAMGTMVFAIDMSGSVSQRELDEFASEAIGAISEVNPQKVYVIYCDSQISHVDEFVPGDEIAFKMHGGGGTDFRPPFEWLAEHGIEPRCFVYLTDGYGPFPEEQHYPVMWCINNNAVVPPHGEHLVLEA